MSNVVDLREYKLDKLAVEVFDGCAKEERELQDATRYQINSFIKEVSDELGMNPCFIMENIFRVLLRNASWEAANENAGALDLLNYMAEATNEAVDIHECRKERDDTDRRYWRCDLYWHRHEALKDEHNKRND